MKFHSLLIAILLLISFGCDKEDPLPEENPVNVIKEQIAGRLSSDSDLSEFNEAFEGLELKPQDVEGGITIFAPVDDDAQGSSGNGIREVTTELLKGHIVKGLIEASGLTDGKTLTTLDGKVLQVTVDREEIRINGALIISKDFVVSEKYVVHKVEQTLTHPVGAEEPATLVVTVWNAAKWTAEKPKGEKEAGVTVALYSSRENFVQGEAVFTKETNAEGNAVFSDAEGLKTYYIAAWKGDLTNVFYRSIQPVDGVHMGRFYDGVFQTQEEVNGHAIQSDGTPGNFRWRDLNFDGIINNDDRTPVPQMEAIPVYSETTVEVIVGYEDNARMTVRSPEDALQTLQASRILLNTFHKTLAMTDGILSDDADCTEGSDWCALDNFAFNQEHPLFLKIWNEAYNTVLQLNVLLRDVPALTFAEKNFVLAEAKGLRAYIYLQMLTYFEAIPTPDGVRIGDIFVRTPVEEVMELVQADLESVVPVLPTGPSGDRHVLTADAVKVLLGRIGLLKKDFVTVFEITDELLQASRYELTETHEQVFSEPENTEIIWDFSFNQTQEFTDYFYGRSFCPALRLGEVYLMNAEAQFELDNIEEGRTNLDIIRSRVGLSPSVEDGLFWLREELRETWQAEMSREGNRFANLVRWNAAQAALYDKGYTLARNELLPIPQTFINNYPTLHQNPGY